MNIMAFAINASRARNDAHKLESRITPKAKMNAANELPEIDWVPKLNETVTPTVRIDDIAPNGLTLRRQTHGVW